MHPLLFHRDGLLVGLRAANTAEDESAQILADVNRFALRPLTIDEIAVFTLDLCNNQVDRHHSRFPDDELARINQLIVGRPLIERHDLRGALPRGTFFRSRLHRDGNCLSVRPDVYVLRTSENAAFIRNIEGGVYRETSIGFAFQVPECSICGKHVHTCGHVPGREYNGALCHFLLRGVVDVLEGSVVACASQGTQFIEARAAAPALPRPAWRAPHTVPQVPRKIWAAE